MLPSARSCIGKTSKSLPAACAETVTPEPLLFLYPRWFRTSLQPRHAARSQARKFSLASSTRSHALSKSVEDEENSYITSAANDPSHTANNVDNESTPLPATMHERSERSEQSEQSISSSATLWMTNSRQPFDQRRMKAVGKGDLAGHTTTLRTARPSRSKWYVPTKIDGLGLAKRLANASGVPLENSETVQMNASFLDWHTGTSGENIWKHHDGSGCLVHVREPSQDGQEKRDVELVGTSLAREIAHQHLLYRERKYLEHHHNAVDRMDEAKTLSSHTYLRVDQLPRPEIWNLRVFAEFVRTILNSQRPRSIERILYKGEEQTFNKTAADVLIDLFGDPKLRPFQSSFALRQALEFCATRTDIAFAAGTIWILARRAGIVPDISCFNFEISRCMRVGNGASVVRLLDEMRTTHIQPNSSTWAIFFRGLNTVEDQTRFLQLPAFQHGNHDRVSQEIMIQALVKTNFHPFNHKPKSVAVFQEKMRSTFGDGWLTPAVVQSMIEQCIDRNAPRIVSQVLKLAADLNVELDAESLTLLVQIVAKTDWFEDVLLLLKIRPLNLEPLYVQKQVEFAFREAWRRRLVNTSRVLWQYAASHGLIRHSMMTKVSAALACNAHPSAKPSAQTNTALTATLVIGTDQSANTDSNAEMAHGAMLDIVTKLRTWLPAGEERHNQLQLAHALLERDMTAWQRVEPMEHVTFLDLLDKAFDLDQIWQDRDLLSTSTLSDILQQAIPIELRPRVSLFTMPEATLQELGTSAVDEVLTPFNEHHDVPMIRDETSINPSFRSRNEEDNFNPHISKSISLCHGTVFDSTDTVTGASVMTANSLPALTDIVLNYFGLVRRDD